MRSAMPNSPLKCRGDRSIRPAAPRAGSARRPGTVMVFVLGILTLLALVGIGLIASTRMDAKRVDNQSSVTSTSDSINSVVKQIQDTLRQDIWGSANSTRPLDNSLQRGTAVNPLGIGENNEPYDACGVDRWISSLMPYNHGPVPVAPVANTNLFTGNTNVQILIPGFPASGELDVLVWPYVSYLGSDLMIPRSGVAGGQVNEFAWLYNTRNNVPNQLVRYGPSNAPTPNALPVNPSLDKVPVIQTWPPASTINGPAAWWAYDAGGAALPMIPGSTTNVSIRLAEEAWKTQQANINSLAQAQGLTAFKARFPYFDTNGDGIVDLYDADGDGVPDSPISFVLDGNAGSPQSPAKLYAIVRVIDHGGMLNANVASSFAFSQNPPTLLMFDESNSNLQRRGRRATELLFDDVCHTRDIWSMGTSNRAWQTVNYRTRNTPYINDPLQYDVNVARRDLIGGLTANLGYRLFGLADEASLRHRFSLVPAAYANYSKAPPTNGVGYDRIDTALPWSTLWTNSLISYSVPNSYPTLSYEQNASRWSRNNADFQPYGSATTYDGWDFNNNTRGWRKLYTEDEPFSIRRPMLTTVSRDVMLPPTDLNYNPATGLAELPPAGTFPVTWMNASTGAQAIVMNDPADPWPLIQGNLPDWMKVLPIDVNMTAAVTANPNLVQAGYMKYMASAMFIALAGVNDASGLVTTAVADRLAVAWQFAANIADYRDSDGIPTAIQLPTGIIHHGLEKQPFFTEAYCRVQYNTEDDTQTAQDRAADDDWFDAVELFIPPTWFVNINNLALRTPGSASPSGQNLGIPLAQFLRAGAPAVLDGNGTSTAANIDTNGAYFVFCGPTAAAPASFTDPLISAAASFYSNPGFEFDHDDGAATPGKVELVYFDPTDITGASIHVIDTIEFNRNGNTMLGNSPTMTPGGGPTLPGPGGGGNFRWAQRDTDPAADTAERFCMARSTKGWRFTIARYQFVLENEAGGQPFFETLGRGNSNQIDPSLGIEQMPEMPWPQRSKLAHAAPLNSEVPNGFVSGTPYEAFDSVIDISRIPLVGNSGMAPASPNSVPLNYETATRSLWEAIARQGGGLPTPGPDLGIAAAHIDFANATRVSMNAPNYGATPVTTGPQQPWSWRLLRYLTASGHANDFVDNDGDGTVDNAMEGPNTLFRMAGRININTAPVTVLRSVPSMTLLPDSLQFTQLLSIAGGAEAALANQARANPYGFYVSGGNAQRFWDFASAIVAAREGRDVAVRQADATGLMQRIALARPAAAVAGGRAYESVGELMEALSAQNISDAAGGNSALFRVDRYTAQGTNLALMGHRANVNNDVAFGPAATPPVPDFRAFSPDFRYRKAEGTQPETIEFTPVGPGDSDANVQAGGIRGRDIYLSRWANLLTTRSDVFTAYITLIDEDGRYVRRAQVTFDRSNCFGEQRTAGNVPTKAVLPDILLKEEGSYSDDTR